MSANVWVSATWAGCRAQDVLQVLGPEAVLLVEFAIHGIAAHVVQQFSQLDLSMARKARCVRSREQLQ